MCHAGNPPSWCLDPFAKRVLVPQRLQGKVRAISSTEPESFRLAILAGPVAPIWRQSVHCQGHPDRL